jgi:hypothetical protein
MGEQLRLQLRLRREQSLDGERGDRLTGRRDAQLLRQIPSGTPRGPGLAHVMRRPALRDRPPEQPLRAGHGEQGADAHRAGRLTEDGDVGGITAEGGDVLPHPLQGRDLVQQADVRDAVAQSEEPFGPWTPVDDHADDAVPGEMTAVVCHRRADLEHAALDPHHDRQPGCPRVRRPDVEVQAVLTGRGGPDRLHAQRRSHLGRLRSQSGGVTDATPGFDRLWRAEPVGAERRCRIGDAQERGHTVGNAAPQLAVRDADDCMCTHHNHLGPSGLQAAPACGPPFVRWSAVVHSAIPDVGDRRGQKQRGEDQVDATTGAPTAPLAKAPRSAGRSPRARR